MTKTLGEKHQKTHRVIVSDYVYQKLQRESDKTGYKIQDLLEMYMRNIYESKERQG